MIKCSVFIAASLDGFIARTDDDISWLTNPVYTIDGEDFGYAKFYSAVDSLVMGRKTYETALSFPEWPYTGKRVVVLSRTPQVIPSHLSGNVDWMSGSPHDVLQQLENANANHIYIDGGKTIQGFLNAGLIDEITLTIIPILLGSGIPLFGPLDQSIQFQLISSRGYSNGFVQSKYKKISKPQKRGKARS